MPLVIYAAALLLLVTRALNRVRFDMMHASVSEECSPYQCVFGLPFLTFAPVPKRARNSSDFFFAICAALGEHGAGDYSGRKKTKTFSNDKKRQ